MLLSLVIPTYNERENIEELLTRIDRAMREAKLSYECLVMDDGSPDGTYRAAERLAERFPVVPVNRVGRPRGLAHAVIEGFGLAKGEIVGSMDGDLQHPPEAIPGAVSYMLREGLDVAVASRYAPGGGVVGWPAHRIILSRIGLLLARPLTRVKDSTSGFFFVRRGLLQGMRLRASGYKVLLELLVRASGARVGEYPYSFQARRRGQSKIGLGVCLDYLLHLARLYPVRFLQ